MCGFEGTDTLRHCWRVYKSVPMLGIVVGRYYYEEIPNHEHPSGPFKSKQFHQCYHLCQC